MHVSLEQDARDTSVPSMPAPRHRRRLTPPSPLCDTARYCTPRSYLLAALQWGIMAPLNLVKVRRSHLTRALSSSTKVQFSEIGPFQMRFGARPGNSRHSRTGCSELVLGRHVTLAAEAGAALERWSV
jgi:hypothetical protein